MNIMHPIFLRSARFGKIAKMTGGSDWASQVPMPAGFHSGRKRLLGNDMGRSLLQKDCRNAQFRGSEARSSGNWKSGFFSLPGGLGWRHGGDKGGVGDRQRQAARWLS